MEKFILSFLVTFSVVFCNGQYSHLWTHTYGGVLSNHPSDIACDTQKNLYLLATATEDYDLDPDTPFVHVSIPFIPEVFLAKYDSTGTYVWHRTMGGIMYIDVDTTGNIYGTGYFDGTIFFDNGIGGIDSLTSSNSGVDESLVICKYSSSGVLIYLKKVDSSIIQPLYDGVSADRNGDIIISGFFNGVTDFDPGPGTAIYNGYPVATFLLKLDPNGDFVFANAYVSSSLNGIHITRHTFDNSSNIVVSGYTDGVTSFGGGVLSYGQFIAKYDPGGNHIFSKSLPGLQNFVGAILTDYSDNILITGGLSQTVDLDPGPPVYVSPLGGFFAKYDSSGNFTYARHFEGGVQDVVTDSSDNIYITCIFYDSVAANPSSGVPLILGGNGLNNSFIMKFDNNGYYIFSGKLLAPVQKYIQGWFLEMDSENNLYLAGAFNGTHDFDMTTGIDSRTTNGSVDYFISKYKIKNQHYLISGKIYSDLNNDSVFNTGDIPLESVIVNVNPVNYFVSTNANGEYYCYVPQGNYMISIPTPPPHYVSIYPASDSALFNPPNNNQVDTANNFALTPDPNAQDLKINIINLGPLRPGFVCGFVLSASNIGTVSLPSSVTFDYPSSLIYTNSYPVADTILPNYLEWNVDTLLPTHSTNLFSEFLVDTVSVSNGDTINILCDIYPYVNDLNQSNNQDGLRLIVQGSWDPNYKEVYPSTNLLPQQADTTLLTYTIHFQNTGTDTAFTISIIDTLSSLLNISTFTLGAGSHPCTTTISENGIVEFNFYNILLPDSGTNFIGSCGFVKYSIRPLQGLTNGQVIENRAHIVFDFNAPVSTNNVQTLIGVTGIQDTELHSGVLIYPNPTSDFITVKNNISEPFTISVKDMFGKTVVQKKSSGEKTVLNLRNLSTGVYFLMVETKNETMIKKLIKQ